MKSSNKVTLATSSLVAAALSGLCAGSAMIDSAMADFSSPDGIHGARAASTMMAGAGSHDTLFDHTGKDSCKGKNECKGHGNCKSGDNGCKGKNSCKGKGGCAATHKE